MDPISITASLLAVIHAAGVCVKGVRKLLSYRKAPDELDRFRMELEGLQALLESVKVFITQNGSIQFGELLHLPIKRAADLMVSVDKILSSPAFGFSGFSEDKKARLTWFRYRQRLMTLAEDIKATKTDLGLRLSLLTAEGYFPIDFVRSIGICKSLVKANPQFRNNPLKKGRGVLHNAARTGNPGEVVDILVQAGADINSLNFDRETPLVNAIYHGRTEMAKRLIALGADVNIANISSQEGPIHFAGNFDRPEILPLLLERGADYTAPNYCGRDIGHCAALFAGVDFIDVMVRSNLKKLNIDKPDRDGKTARDYISGRIIMKDQEIGIHEAFDTLAASLSPYSRLVLPREDSLDELESQASLVTEIKPPGAFPSDQ